MIGLDKHPRPVFLLNGLGEGLVIFSIFCFCDFYEISNVFVIREDFSFLRTSGKMF